MEGNQGIPLSERIDGWRSAIARHSHVLVLLKIKGELPNKKHTFWEWQKSIYNHTTVFQTNLYIWDPFLINTSSPGGAAPVRLLQLRLWPQRTRLRRWIHQQNHHERYPKRPKLPKRWRLGCLAVSQMTLCFEWSFQGLLLEGEKFTPKWTEKR